MAPIARLAHAPARWSSSTRSITPRTGRSTCSDWGCDFLACSAYKFFGPHVGILWGRRELLESLPAYKVRPAPDTLPDRWMTGTQNHEGIAGVAAAVEYLADLGDPHLQRRHARGMAAIRDIRADLGRRLLDGLAERPRFRVWGIGVRIGSTNGCRRSRSPSAIGRRSRSRSTWPRGRSTSGGNMYALELTGDWAGEPAGLAAGTGALQHGGGGRCAAGGAGSVAGIDRIVPRPHDDRLSQFDRRNLEATGAITSAECRTSGGHPLSGGYYHAVRDSGGRSEAA